MIYDVIHYDMVFNYYYITIRDNSNILSYYNIIY